MIHSLPLHSLMVELEVGQDRNGLYRDNVHCRSPNYQHTVELVGVAELQNHKDVHPHKNRGEEGSTSGAVVVQLKTLTLTMDPRNKGGDALAHVHCFFQPTE